MKVRSHGAAAAVAVATQQLDYIVTNGFVHMTIFTCGSGCGNASKWVWNLFCAAVAEAW